jgi:hypothetical protein
MVFNRLCDPTSKLGCLRWLVNADLTFPKSAEVKFPTTAVAAISRFQ